MNIIIGIITFLLMLVLIDKLDYKNKLTFFCKCAGWHKAPIRQSFDGVSRHGKCARCNKKVLQDSNGDWF